MKNLFVFLVLFLFGISASAQPSFTAEEAQVTYYEMGWDSMDEATTWSYSPTAQGNFTWHLDSNAPYTGQPSFSSIDPRSKYSLVVKTSSTDWQNEVAASPTIEIRENSTVEFYACFRSVFLVFASWYFYVIDLDNDDILYTLNAFTWSQDRGFTGPSWQKFVVDLKPYAGKKVAFAFQQTGPDGEDLAIDGFCLRQNTEADDARISIFEEQQVHYVDTSVGATAWQWSFPGGEPSESTEQHPVVTYPSAGSYGATLTITLADGTCQTVTRTGYVDVQVQAPTALFAMKDAGYLSPWVAAFVAPGTTVQYEDLSAGKPTAWQWTFPGGSPAESSEQNPAVVYNEQGLYGMTLTVSNQAGSSDDFMKDALQVGGSQYVWNIGLDEYDLMGELSLGLFGYYGGTNWLGIDRFAERFAAPAEPVTIDRVQVWFYRAEVAAAASDLITVDIRKAGLGGKTPNTKALAEVSIPLADIAYDPDELVPTTFVFPEPVTVSGPFFVTVGPFPSGDDAVSILAVRRADGGRSTTAHYMENEDSEGNRLGTFRWWDNTDEPVSLCITPHLTYASSEADGVEAPAAAAPAAPQAIGIFNMQGQYLSNAQRGLNIINGRKVLVK